MSSLINRSAVKTFILKKLESMRPWLGFTRVSGAALDVYEGRIRAMIIKDIKDHPSRGKTFRLD